MWEGIRVKGTVRSREPLDSMQDVWVFYSGNMFHEDGLQVICAYKSLSTCRSVASQPSKSVLCEGGRESCFWASTILTGTKLGRPACWTTVSPHRPLGRGIANLVVIYYNSVKTHLHCRIILEESCGLYLENGLGVKIWVEKYFNFHSKLLTEEF